MLYYSTNRNSQPASFCEAVKSGVAGDGGLFLPTDIPLVPAAVFRNMPEMSLSDIAYVVLNTLIGEDVDSATIKSINASAFNFDIPVVALKDSKLFSCELFHGPTGSVKDLGARYLARLCGTIFSGESDANHPVTVLATVSSDNGLAIADAFHDVYPCDVFVVFAKGRISPATRDRIIEIGANIHPVEVRGSNNDCLAMIRTALFDAGLKGHIALTSANSINIARLLPTTIQYFHSWACAVAAGADSDNIVISVPCANLSNLSAALIAVRMGLPVKRLIAATNSNDAFVEYLQTGVFHSKPAVETVTPAMDITQPMNLPRIKELMSGISVPVEGVAMSDNKIIATADELKDKYDYIANLHSCVSAGALIRNIKADEYGIFLSTVAPVPDSCPAASRHRIDSISPTYHALKRIINPTSTF
ncbi:MAG: pyridoxal-phosphate dependent enzyme [Paramuribaculum sp.]|nr:pyridoxal-phosphate dependent enzyme [Paramuribaculum sp.]